MTFEKAVVLVFTLLSRRMKRAKFRIGLRSEALKPLKLPPLHNHHGIKISILRRCWFSVSDHKFCIWNLLCMMNENFRTPSTPTMAPKWPTQVQKPVEKNFKFSVSSRPSSAQNISPSLASPQKTFSGSPLSLQSRPNSAGRIPNVPIQPVPNSPISAPIFGSKPSESRQISK